MDFKQNHYMEIGNIAKAATFKSILHLSYQNTQLLFFVCDSVFQYFYETNINQWFLGVTRKYELGISFKHFYFSQEKEIVEYWLIYANKFFMHHPIMFLERHNKMKLVPTSFYYFLELLWPL